MTHTLSDKSRRKLAGVHRDLAAVVEVAIAISPVDFCVGEGLRSASRQAELIKLGKSQAIHSRHLTGHAVDLYALVDGVVNWKWPLYEKINEAMQQAAAKVGVPVTWGGSWRTLKDGVHFELPRDKYP